MNDKKKAELLVLATAAPPEEIREMLAYIGKKNPALLFEAADRVLTPNVLLEARKLLDIGQKVPAIKLLRETYRWTLAEAINWCRDQGYKIGADRNDVHEEPQKDL